MQIEYPKLHICIQNHMLSLTTSYLSNIPAKNTYNYDLSGWRMPSNEGKRHEKGSKWVANTRCSLCKTKIEVTAYLPITS